MVSINRYTIAAFSFMVLITCLVLPQSPRSQDDPNPNQISSGFEDDEKSDDEMQEVMEGFDKEAGAEKSSGGLKEDEILEGFEEDKEEKAYVDSEKQYLPSYLNLDGYFKLGSSYNLFSHTATGTDTNWQGLSRLRTEIMLELDVEFSDFWQARVAGHGFYDFAYRIRGRNNFTDEVLDDYENELEFDEVWLQGSLAKSFDLKTGRQFVVWGKSDNIRITDVLNPLNLREPGLTDIENLRLPVTMTKLDYYFSGLNLSGIVIHEVRYNKNPVFGSDFFPAPQPLPSKERPKEGFDINNTQFAAALHGIFRGWDASLYGAYIFDQTAHFDTDTVGPPPELKLKHAPLKMAGAAFNIARGNWLFKTEAAYFDGIRFFNGGGKDYKRIDALAGAEYSGFTNMTISLEFADRHIINYDNQLKDDPDITEKDEFISALRITKTYLNDTLTLTMLAQTFGVTGDDGAFQRFTAEYDWTDSIEITGGVVFYQSGDLIRFNNVGKNDRLYFEIKYNF